MPSCVRTFVQRLAEAKRTVKNAYCSVGRLKKSFAQKPKPGAKRPAGMTVNVVVSKGERRRG